ncbi:hypothetical protein ACTORR_19620 [Pseudomonas sp. SAR267]|uniref:hypothetical protein n=1 Tax=Pseudomonas sp. SAR267 TaxID=3454502 RepID=UPI003F917B93
MQAKKELDLTIYHAHPVTGEFIGVGEARIDPLDDTFLLIPAHACQVKPPEVSAQQAAVLADGEWSVKPDYRGLIYSTSTGEAHQYHDIGELPEGFTSVKWPGEDFVWTSEGWELDTVARAAREAERERAWRNEEVDRVKWLRERHRDEQEMQEPTTLTAEQYAEVLSYLQLLRNWPQSELFPDSSQRPAIPEGVALALATED